MGTGVHGSLTRGEGATKMAAWRGRSSAQRAKGALGDQLAWGCRSLRHTGGLVSRFPCCRTGSRHVRPAACSIFLPPVGLDALDVFYRFRTYHPKGDRVAHGHAACLSSRRTEPGPLRGEGRGPRTLSLYSLRWRTHPTCFPGRVASLS